MLLHGHPYMQKRRAVIDDLALEQKATRSAFAESGLDRQLLSGLPRLKAHVPPGASAGYLAGWSGEPVDDWRIRGRDMWWDALVEAPRRTRYTGEDTSYWDFADALMWLDRVRGNREDFTKWWLDEVQAAQIPRTWLRWAMTMLQARTKVTEGNAVDAQHATYLSDSDLFLSADVRFMTALKVIQGFSPVRIAEPRLVKTPLNASPLDNIAAALDEP
jgi:hypothetical protein